MNDKQLNSDIAKIINSWNGTTWEVDDDCEEHEVPYFSVDDCIIEICEYIKQNHINNGRK